MIRDWYRVCAHQSIGHCARSSVMLESFVNANSSAIDGKISATSVILSQEMVYVRAVDFGKWRAFNE